MLASVFEAGSTEGVGQRVEDFRIANKIYTKVFADVRFEQVSIRGLSN
jgi:hypothetical protein